MTGQNIRQCGRRISVSFSEISVVLAVSFILLFSFGVNAAFGVFFKPVSNDFGWTKAMTSGAFSLSWVTSGLVGIVMGRLNDRFGSRGVITFCGFLLGLGYLMMARMSALFHLYLYYGVIVGVGMSGIWVPAMSTIARWFGDKKGIISGIVMVGGGVGALVAPPVADWLISKLDWRMSSLVLGGLVLVVVVLAAQFLRRPPSKVEEMSSHHDEREGDRPRRVAEPLSLQEAVHTRQFWLLLGMIFSLGFGAYVIMVHLVPHCVELGISSASAANILGIVGGIAIVGKVILGSVGDRIGNRQVFIIGFILMAAASFWLLSAREEWEMVLFAAVFGFGFSAGVSSSPLVAELFGLSSHGLILGVNVLSYSMGAAAGPLAAGYLSDVTGSYQAAFLACAISGILGLVVTGFITPIRGRERK